MDDNKSNYDYLRVKVFTHLLFFWGGFFYNKDKPKAKKKEKSETKQEESNHNKRTKPIIKDQSTQNQ